ncbi:hypothetical protein [Synechococcus sp. 1G10]|uniref:hypothetical protein n=1 Tax=Synechococcus sp. 1G10 TaxID=2025605 RepID=UPI0011809C91|nr:hypothetical protein [Synechococcus sp. 1G10]
MSKKLALAIAGSLSLAISPLGAKAASYDALCGNVNCNVSVTADEFITPSGGISRDQITSWNQGGQGATTSIGTGIATTIIFGVPGLIGFLAKNYDYRFTISYADGAGNPAIQEIRFVNNKPAVNFAYDMSRLTGLASGQRSEKSIALMNEKKAAEAEKARIASLDCGKVLKQYNCSWDMYLSANPSVATWAASYPSMANVEKARLGAVD